MDALFCKFPQRLSVSFLPAVKGPLERRRTKGLLDFRGDPLVLGN
jgi:hypothetical protein